MVDGISYIRGVGCYIEGIMPVYRTLAQLNDSPSCGETCLHLGHQLASAPIQIGG